MNQISLGNRDLYTQKKITQLLQALDQIDKKINLFQSRLANEGPSQYFDHQIQRWQSFQAQYKEEFKALGVTEKRGRPKKEAADTYKAKRVKFTAHLLPENHEYVKQLKARREIKNVSSFLDDLIEQHKKIKTL